MQKASKKLRISLPVKVIAIILMTFPLMILGMIFTSLYIHFIRGYPIPQNVSWALDLLFQFVISVIIMVIAIQLFRGKNYARILTAICLFIISILNLRAELFIADSPSIFGLIFNFLFFLSALYLIFNKKVKRTFS
jgi:hypothetical protein